MLSDMSMTASEENVMYDVPRVEKRSVLSLIALRSAVSSRNDTTGLSSFVSKVPEFRML